MTNTNLVWRNLLEQLISAPDNVTSPRGLKTNEIINASYKIPMPAFIDLSTRKVNCGFMFAEAAMLVSGSNRLDDVKKYMNAYAQFSDDGLLMRGSYGPPFVDQIGYVVDCLLANKESRQAVITFWRQRPGLSLDIPCTVSAQFLIRENKLHSIFNMRSQDIVKGFTFDAFSFSMMSRAVQLMYSERSRATQNAFNNKSHESIQSKKELALGALYVACGSLHLYNSDYRKAEAWIGETKRNLKIKENVSRIMEAETYLELIDNLWNEAENSSNIKESERGK